MTTYNIITPYYLLEFSEKGITTGTSIRCNNKDFKKYCWYLTEFLSWNGVINLQSPLLNRVKPGIVVWIFELTDRLSEPRPRLLGTDWQERLTKEFYVEKNSLGQLIMIKKHNLPFQHLNLPLLAKDLSFWSCHCRHQHRKKKNNTAAQFVTEYCIVFI